MTTKKVPVAFDLAGVGVRRPVLSVPDKRPVGGGVAATATAQAVASMTLPTLEPGFQIFRNNSSHATTRPAVGVGRPQWMAGRLQGDSGSEDNSSMTIDSSLKKEATERPSTPAHWDRSAPMSKSLNGDEDSAMAQQARKAAVMYGSPLYQALRSTSALRDEAQVGAHQSSTLLGKEPSSSHSTGTTFVPPVPLYTRMKGNSAFENGAQQRTLSQQHQHQQQHPNQGAYILAAGHGFERPAGAGKHPSTEQLTIFYAGTVNVYDDVPVDKAQAIMLLAGTESPWSANPKYTNLPGSGANPGRPFPTLGRMNHPISRAGSPAPQLVAPYNSGSLLGAGANLPNRPKFTMSVELPQARKASLARFLEKRKDRARTGPYTLPNDEAARNDALRRSYSRENSPSHSDHLSPSQ